MPTCVFFSWLENMLNGGGGRKKFLKIFTIIFFVGKTSPTDHKDLGVSIFSLQTLN